MSTINRIRRIRGRKRDIVRHAYIARDCRLLKLINSSLDQLNYRIEDVTPIVSKLLRVDNGVFEIV